jgi:hypothetical protein
MYRSLFLPILSAVPLLCLTTGDARAEFTFADTAGDHLDVLQDGKPLLRWQYAFDKSSPERLHDTYKPYLHVMDAAGKEPITKGPGGDFTHHRGWFLGWSKITTADGATVDRWHMKGGNIIQQKILTQTPGKDSASFSVLLHWQGTTEAPILSEERTFTILSAPAPAYALVEMRSDITALTGETSLNGDPEHAGLQFRPAGNLERALTAYVYPKQDADAHKDRDYPWVAENFSLNEKRYSVALLNHPDNPKDTPFSAYRDYGRFGGFFHTVVPAGGKVTLKARLLVSEGSVLSPEQIQKAANAFTGKDEPTPVVTLKPAETPAPKKEKAPEAKTIEPKK